MKTQYNLVSVINARVGRGMNVASQYGGNVARFADNSDNRTLTPYYGIPMAARDTLLAQLLGNSKTAATVLREGAPENSPYVRVMSQVREMKGKFKRSAGMSRPSAESLAKAHPGLVGSLLGVEIECYPKDYIESDGLTNVTSDGSLRDGGREIRRITWINSSGRLGGLLGLREKLAGAKVDSSCGLHVHVDARHLPEPGRAVDGGKLLDAAQTYDRLTLLYPMLKKLVPRSRWNNRYCRFVNNRSDSDAYNRPSNGQRYAAINWCSYQEHRTIEFRLAPGSTNLVKIESWALLCKYLVGWCANPDNQVPTTWSSFLAILPEWMANWCLIRNMKLHGKLGRFDERVGSAADFDVSGGMIQ